MILEKEPIEKARYNDLASKFNALLLDDHKSQKARDYLAERGIDDHLIKKFNIGWCPEQTHIQNLDILAGRIIFPIRDEYGDTIAFSGRLPVKKSDIPKEVPHYWNDPFPKSLYLYNLDKAWPQILFYGFTIIVEGNCDVITCYKHGIKNVVATMGTAFTREHFGKLSRFGTNFILMFDSDEGGRKASFLAKSILSGYRDCSVLDINLNIGGKGYDPDEFIGKFGSQELRKQIEKKSNEIGFEIGVWNKWL